MRARVFDEWVKQQMIDFPQSIILRIGCGMDSRNLRVGSFSNCWYDVDFPEVIAERKKYYSENEKYHMLGADASKTDWIESLPEFSHAIVILEGISMYLKNEDVTNLFSALQRKFKKVNILMDAYSKYKNPINDVRITQVYGIDEPKSVIKDNSIEFIKEHTMTPPELVNELSGFDKLFFSTMFTGTVARKLYRLFEYKTL